MIRVAVTTDDDHAVVSVRDAGLGFSPEVKATLFEPFAQAEETLAQSPEGLGLGLALVRGLVELHGGTVQAESDGPGTGSTFAIRIPQANVPHAPATVRTNGSRPFASCRSLVIEDNRDVLRTIVRILELNGHQVATATDGLAGVELARRLLPEVVFCDIGLPGEIDGYAVARALRADPSTSSAYLVAVTGFGQDEDRRRAIEAGFDRHLMKPADHAEILAVAAEVAASRLTHR